MTVTDLWDAIDDVCVECKWQISFIRWGVWGHLLRQYVIFSTEFLQNAIGTFPTVMRYEWELVCRGSCGCDQMH